MKCPRCVYPMKKTDWIPPKGYDPQLRQFKCPKCDTEIYTLDQRFKEEKAENDNR